MPGGNIETDNSGRFRYAVPRDVCAHGRRLFHIFKENGKTFIVDGRMEEGRDGISPRPFRSVFKLNVFSSDQAETPSFRE